MLRNTNGFSSILHYTGHKTVCYWLVPIRRRLLQELFCSLLPTHHLLNFTIISSAICLLNFTIIPEKRERESGKTEANCGWCFTVCVFVIIKLLCCRFSAVILKRIQFMLFFCLFFTNSSRPTTALRRLYWRRPRDGGRQNKERQGVHARTYGTTHLFNSHTHRELYDLCLIFRFAGFGCEILVAVLLWNTPPPPPGGWRWSSSSSVAEDSQSECVCLLLFVAC